MKKHRIITILSLVIAFAAVIVPILWDYFSSRTLLQIQVLSNTQIVGKIEEFDRIEVTYDGKKYGSISKIEFLIINIGSVPITGDMTKVPPYVTLGAGVDVLQANITKAVPEQVTSSIKVDNESIVIDAPLLNPNDTIYFSALASGDDFNYTAGGRIAGIRSVELWNRIAEERNPRELSGTFFWSLAGGLFVIMWFAEAVKEVHGAKDVIQMWLSSSSMQKKVLAMQLKDSYKLLYNRDAAQRKIGPLLILLSPIFCGFRAWNADG